MADAGGEAAAGEPEPDPGAQVKRGVTGLGAGGRTGAGVVAAGHRFEILGPDVVARIGGVGGLRLGSGSWAGRGFVGGASSGSAERDLGEVALDRGRGAGDRVGAGSGGARGDAARGASATGAGERRLARGVGSTGAALISAVISSRGSSSSPPSSSVGHGVSGERDLGRVT